MGLPLVMGAIAPNPSHPLAPLVLLILCPVLGALPLVDLLTQGLTGKRLKEQGTGNLSVSAAFYHGGRWVGLGAVATEALKGMGAVVLARQLGLGSAWELWGLAAVVAGRYGRGQGAGATNVAWGYGLHDPWAGLGVAIVGGGVFGVLRSWGLGRYGRWIPLGLIPLAEGLRSPQDPFNLLAAMGLCGLMAGIYRGMPDDLQLKPEGSHPQSRGMLRFLRGESRDPRGLVTRGLVTRGLVSLDQPLDPAWAGTKAATLSQLRRWGYPVPPGWVLPGGVPERVALAQVQPTPEQPWVVRSSAGGEDGSQRSGAGQYLSLLGITNPEDLLAAIAQVRQSQGQESAQRYHRDLSHGRDRPLSPDGPMAVILQPQIPGVCSGVAFSRDPLQPGTTVLVEGAAGGAEGVVSGRVTPWQRAIDPEGNPEGNPTGLDQNPDTVARSVATLARELERRYHGIPQDMEWSQDPQGQLWILQTRPITTLTPLWTRKIAAEVIPGAIRPLTWSINQPLTCGVWGQLFALGLGDRRSAGLDFQATATLHRSHAYFNATLLGEIFQRLGLPPESLEFLTLGAKFTRPPWHRTGGNLPGLGRLAQRLWRLPWDFHQDDRRLFQPALAFLAQHPPGGSAPRDVLIRLDRILDLLPQATYYQILAPLGFALGQAVLKIPLEALDSSALPEVSSLRSLTALAHSARALLEQQGLIHQGELKGDLIPGDPLVYWDNAMDAAELPQVLGGSELPAPPEFPAPEQLPAPDRNPQTTAVIQALASFPEGLALWQQVQTCIQRYGYLSDVGTDIAIPNWQDDPTPAEQLFGQLVLYPPGQPGDRFSLPASPQAAWGRSWLQNRLDLKGQVATVYLQLLGHVRGHFLVLGEDWTRQGYLNQPEDLFFLTWPEIRQGITEGSQLPTFRQTIRDRQHQWHQDQQQPVPSLVYGFCPGVDPLPAAPQGQRLQGIGASRGQVEGTIQVIRTLRDCAALPPGTIAVVPYTDAGWAPLLAQATGLIAETGGRLSHGAIVAREYGIPAVMAIPAATQIFPNGQRVRLDGQQGWVELLP